MNRIITGIVSFAMLGGVAHATQLTKTKYSTARKAALAGAAFAFTKAASEPGSPGRIYRSTDVKIIKNVDARGPKQKFTVRAYPSWRGGAAGIRQKTVTVVKDGAKWRAYIPSQGQHTGRYGDTRRPGM